MRLFWVRVYIFLFARDWCWRCLVPKAKRRSRYGSFRKCENCASQRCARENQKLEKHTNRVKSLLDSAWEESNRL
jgi:hypothetical protein